MKTRTNGEGSGRAPLDRFLLGKTLTALANASVKDMVQRPCAAPPKTRAFRIGLTGAPGAGKSTLCGQLALHRLTQSKTPLRVGVLAVDPSSPKSGGAILGDRIRMDDLPGSADLYIRSIGSRAATDGLSDNLPEMLDAMDAHGFDELLLETVGVGQAEYAARAQVDTLVLVLLPDSGDTVQAMKAGIMELADIYVVNKADLPGAQRMVADIRRIAAMTRMDENEWRPPVVLTSSQQPGSIAALSQENDRHHAWTIQKGLQEQVLDGRARYRLRRLVERRLVQTVSGLDQSTLSKPMPQQIDAVLGELARW